MYSLVQICHPSRIIKSPEVYNTTVIRHTMHTVCSDCISNGILNILPCSSSPDPFLLPTVFHDLSASSEIFEKNLSALAAF